MKIYVASTLNNAPRVREVIAALRGRGYTITYDWTSHGAVGHLGHDRLREVASLEMIGVLSADLVVVLLPGGRGTHVELGLAMASDKRVIIVGPPAAFEATDATCAFYHHERVDLLPMIDDFDTSVVADFVSCLKIENPDPGRIIDRDVEGFFRAFEITGDLQDQYKVKSVFKHNNLEYTIVRPSKLKPKHGGSVVLAAPVAYMKETPKPAERAKQRRHLRSVP